MNSFLRQFREAPRRRRLERAYEFEGAGSRVREWCGACSLVLALCNVTA